MRTALALILVLLGALRAVAQPVTVTSGEHRDFTRIVLQFAEASDWVFGRTLDGYALRLPGDMPDYDLSRAFDLIGKTRLGSLKPDPLTGDLELGLACACHAMPFEFRPGVVVIDLYDGPPPAGSSFEQAMPALIGAAGLEAPAPPALEASAPADEAPAPGPDPEALVGGYDWTRLSLEQMGLAPGEPTAAANNSPEVALPEALAPDIDKLRMSLVEEMSRGATAGLIDLAPPEAPAEAAQAEASHEAASPEASHSDAAQADASHADDAHAEGAEPPSEEELQAMMSHLGETPDLVLRDSGEDGPALTASGATCIPDEELEVEAWGTEERPLAEQIGPIRQGIVGEFDRPSPDAIERVVRFYLYNGFGAEARSLVRAYPDLLEAGPIWTSMARVIDGEPDPDSAFKGMEDCATAAALWAVLSDPSALPKDEIGRAAVARSFSALPLSLRRLLGPRLVEAYIAGEDIPMATAISSAVLRAPGDAGPEVAMMEADLQRATGKHAEAEAVLEPLANTPGPASTDALVDLVQHRAMLGQSVTEDQVKSLEAALQERIGSEEEPRYRSALVLAKAASGDFDTAFAEAETPEALRQIWKILSQVGGDTPLLVHAVLGEGQTPPPEAEASAGIVAQRLLTLGLADQAARWIVLAPRAPNLLQAKIKLANGDAQGALDLLTDETAPPALHVKAEALQLLGDLEGVAKIYEELGKSEQQMSVLTETQDWQQVSQSGPEEWKALAGIVSPDPAAAPAAPEGQLAEGKRLLDESSSTRDAITNLLNSVQVPAPPSQ